MHHRPTNGRVPSGLICQPGPWAELERFWSTVLAAFKAAAEQPGKEA
jgi:hypothetical protein